MTTAPPNLLAVRALIRPHFGLSAVETGIIGDANHAGGYHHGRPKVPSSDYSYRESNRDGPSLTEFASALDVGYWEKRVAGKQHTLRSFSVWLVAQCRANAADTRDIREVIYSADGRTVKRWDRLGRRSTGDSSHLSHTHISFHRDAIKAGRDQRPVFTRYLQSIGLLEDDDMFEDPDRKTLKAVDMRLREFLEGSESVPGDLSGATFAITVNKRLRELSESVAAIRATPPGTVVVSDEQLERVLRKVVGSVDGASPAS